MTNVTRIRVHTSNELINDAEHVLLWSTKY